MRALSVVEINEVTEPKKQKRTQSGKSTSDVIKSAYQSGNSEVFRCILELFAKPGFRIADVTYGKGVFWRSIDTDKYDFSPSDIDTGVDCRKLPYGNESLDMLVFDPPYMEGLFRKKESHLAGSGTHKAFREFYSNGKASHNELKYHDAVVDLYALTGLEAKRTLKDKGFFVVKCQDEVSANRQKLTHVELIYLYEKMGFYCKDIFVVMRSNAPVISRLVQQQHSRKNHSYFLILQKFSNKSPYKNIREDLLERYGLI
jgi:hypothetical protein